MKEKDIIGYEGKYKINTDGDVWSYASNRFLKRRLNKNGYPSVTLCVDYNVKNMTIHRLIYTNFISDIPKGLQINHIDGVKTNNRLDNLEICTPKENTHHAWRTGLAKKKFGSETSCSKLKDGDVKKILKLVDEGFKQSEIASLFNVCQSNISKIVTNVTWNHVK